MRWINAFLAMLLLAFGTTESLADETVALLVGYHWAAAPDFSHSSGARLPEPDASMPGLGFQLYRTFTRGVGVGFDFSIAFPIAPATNGDYRLQSSITTASGKAGYSLRADRWTFTPMVGVQPAFYHLDYRRKSETSAERELAGGADSGSLDGLAWAGLAELQVRFQYRERSVGSECPRIVRSFVGLGLGYAQAPADIDWRRFDENVSGGPEYRYQSAFARILWGFE